MEREKAKKRDFKVRGRISVKIILSIIIINITTGMLITSYVAPIKKDGQIIGICIRRNRGCYRGSECDYGTAKTGHYRSL